MSDRTYILTLTAALCVAAIIYDSELTRSFAILGILFGIGAYFEDRLKRRRDHPSE